MPTSQQDKALRFRALHEAPGSFVIPNPWDGASARILAGLGFQALATSSGAQAGTLGRRVGGLVAEALFQVGGDRELGGQHDGAAMGERLVA